MSDVPAPKVSLLPDSKIVRQITGAIAVLSLVTLLLFFFFLPVAISTTGLLIMGVATIGFFILYFLLPRLYFHETLLLVGDALYVILITYIASLLGEYGVFILFLYFVIIIADALKYPLSEYVIVVIFTVQAAFFYILLGTPFPFNIRLGILTVFAFSTLSTALFIWYFSSQILSERSLRSLIEKKSSYLKAMNDHLQAVDHMRRNMMQVTSHEFRTPLTRIRYSLEQLRNSNIAELTPEQLQLLQIADDSSAQLTQMIKDLMAASRASDTKSEFSPQKHDLVQLLKSLLSGYQSLLAAKKQKLIVHLPNKPVHALIDLALIQIAVKNLIDNATEYTPVDGTIIVSLTLTESEVLLSVKDTGMGIAATDLPNLFSQFYRSEKAILTKPDGFGIGLYLAQQIVHQHGGDITVTSKEGKGSTFTIHLPKTILQDHD